MTRAIIHVDMDAFYASVEQLDNPELRGRPVIVGGTGERGVVAAASYEARRFGVRSAMPGREARKRCPDGVFLPVRMARYREMSAHVFACFHEVTPLVEGLSLDEAFLDVTASLRGKTLEGLGRALKARIREQTGLTASLGLAPNKLVAKIASELDKPDGFCLVAPERAAEVLGPLPITAMWGIGPRTADRLHGAGIHTLQQLREAPAGLLEAHFGRYAERYRRLAAGIDERPVVADSEEKSISAEETWPTDRARGDELHARLLALCEEVAERVRRRGLKGGTLTLKIREADFTTHTRSRSFEPPTDSTAQIHALADELLDRWFEGHPGAALRLLGVGLSRFEERNQLDLFGHAGEPDRLDRLVDEVRERFGGGALKRGRLVDSGDS
ncbi:MAG: DNA polymerase IV [Gammaproteobacteria bacterium]